MPYRTYSREQDWLLPPSLGDLLPADHAVRFVAEFVDMLELAAVSIAPEAAVEGAPAYPPKMLLSAWLYGFMTKVRSSRKIEQACRENIAFMWLTGMQRPDHVTLWRFYQRHRSAMRGLLKETVRVAATVGLVDFALQAVDGCRVAISSGDGLRDRPHLEQLLAQVEAEIEAMEHAHEAAADQAGGARPQALLGKQQLRERIQHALAVVQAKKKRAQAPAAAPVGARHNGEVVAGTHRAPGSAQRVPRKKKRPKKVGPLVSPTDPEAVLLKGRHGYCVGYNGQAVVDSRAQIVVAADVVAQAGDVDQLASMLEEAVVMTGRRPQAVVADTGYHNIPQIVAVQAAGSDPYVPDRRANRSDAPAQDPYHKSHFSYAAATDSYRCPEGQQLTFRGAHQWKTRLVRSYQAADCRNCPVRQRGACTTAKARGLAIHGYEAQLEAHAVKMQSAAAHALLARRRAIVEPVFAVFREHLGLQRFLLRGLANVKAEWRLLCCAHNLRKLWKLWWQPRVLARVAT